MRFTDEDVKDPKNWALGVVTSLLLSFVSWHILTVGDMREETSQLREEIAKLVERSKNRYERLKDQSENQKKMLGKLGEINTTLNDIKLEFAGYAVVVRQVERESLRSRSRINELFQLASYGGGGK